MTAQSAAGPANGFFKNSDILVAGALLLIVVMMVVPLPAAALDLLLTFNLSLALLVLLVTLYTTEPLQFSVFPALLLMATLFRLALNVSSTRLILLYGDAGDLIAQFGAFVIGGNAVVGCIIFLILVVIQFMVITRGAERVAEVAARFTLDAMPGKQMSIDADLNAGIITETEARQRRRDVEREADFYGAMDGASKFVKGDAIAGIIITLINIGGGFVIGIVQGGMSWAEALQTYTLLTVGDGLVSQIPALLISTATGIMVTRAASAGSLGGEMIGQIFSQGKSLGILAAVLLLFGLVPSLPQLPFLILSAGSAFLAWRLNQAESAGRREAAAAPREAEPRVTPENVLGLMPIDALEIELGYGLIPLGDTTQGGDLLDRIIAIRKQFALEQGLVLPLVRIRDNLQLKPNDYVLKIKGTPVAEGELLPGYYLAMNPGLAEETIDGIPTTEPVFGLAAYWVTENERDNAAVAGYTVVDLPTVVATHLTEIIKRFGYELLGRQEVSVLVDAVKEGHGAVVSELIPALLTLGEIQKVLQNLLREGVSIRTLPAILETLADHARATRDPDILTEYVRQALGRAISRQCRFGPGVNRVITLDPALEQLILDGIQRTEQGTYFALEPGVAGRVAQSLAREMQKMAAQGLSPVVLCSPVVRFYFKRFSERAAPGLTVLSYNELEPDTEVQSVGTVTG